MSTTTERQPTPIEADLPAMDSLADRGYHPEEGSWKYWAWDGGDYRYLTAREMLAVYAPDLYADLYGTCRACERD